MAFIPLGALTEKAFRKRANALWWIILCKAHPSQCLEQFSGRGKERWVFCTLWAFEHPGTSCTGRVTALLLFRSLTRPYHGRWDPALTRTDSGPLHLCSSEWEAVNQKIMIYNLLGTSYRNKCDKEWQDVRGWLLSWVYIQKSGHFSRDPKDSGVSHVGEVLRESSFRWKTCQCRGSR